MTLHDFLIGLEMELRLPAVPFDRSAMSSPDCPSPRGAP
jgi:hypothetical protein